MANVATVLRRPMITEKSTWLREENQFVVEVAPDATKGQIREAIETRFKVDVVSVRTIKILGKYRRRIGPLGGYQSNGKKAIIRVKAGQQIKWEEVA